MRKFSELRLWLSILLVFVYVFIADMFFDYIINVEFDGFLQMVFSITFLAITFYTGKAVYLLWKKKNNV